MCFVVLLALVVSPLGTTSLFFFFDKFLLFGSFGFQYLCINRHYHRLSTWWHYFFFLFTFSRALILVLTSPGYASPGSTAVPKPWEKKRSGPFWLIIGRRAVQEADNFLGDCFGSGFG